jgi:hypothetical protein
LQRGELLERFDQTPRLVQLMWRPLCLAALNTPPERASAQVFLATCCATAWARKAQGLRHAAAARRPAGALFPDRAALVEAHAAARCAAAPRSTRWRRGQTLARRHQRRGRRHLEHLRRRRAGHAAWQAPPCCAPCPAWTPPPGAQLAASPTSRSPPATCNTSRHRLPLPFCALLDDPATGAWGQFVFDRGQLDPAQAGLLAVVISASQRGRRPRPARAGAASRPSWRPFPAARELGQPSWTQVITEKRATFACTPGLQRPGNADRPAGLVLAGDYTASDYPATLESAVRSGWRRRRPGVGGRRLTKSPPQARLPRKNCSLSHAHGAGPAPFGYSSTIEKVLKRQAK